ncbi:hypothetical protein M406DRAFT_345466 [Cryphonectria parasitica EP155]|uniref:polynucleotide adenylyltransferase n=1 Tax=Cryphonectria parasitica (strain ATCC 38755 / EP155) TaxID=660469 RepID=A0A9P4Y681_CRYP1|nr:uncharacterized protein M406DRAFT_345466 [Cryphonectria parasitica EP155]KAF3767473.1 hypothetical protein M406DRAFT_345466 [Cryphonectria parasitica EP155]
MADGNQQDDMPLDVRMRNLILKNAEKSQTEGDPSPKSRQKRPNQAQRRQMSSQLNIPIDHRSVQAQENRHHGNFSSQYHHRQNHQHRNQRSQPNAIPPANMHDGYARGGPPPQNRHHPSPSYPGFSSSPAHSDWRQPGGGQMGYQGYQTGPARSNPFGRNSMTQGRSLYNPHLDHAQPDNLEAQVALLEKLTTTILANAEIDLAQIQEKENFRLLIEEACRAAITEHHNAISGRSDFPPMSVQLRCFGSLASGFATKSADMDLGLLSPLSHPQPDAPGSEIPRIVEKTFLNMGFGARLLTKTRVPIIKVCQKPPQKLYADLLEERERWERGDEEDQDLEEDDPHDDPYQAQLNKLKQGGKALSTYYGAAKKLLRELGGRDITNSTAASFSKGDFRILNDVCSAFVHGLADGDLRTRLQRYLSLSFDSTAPMSINRSIYGVILQIEGEKMVMAWESRSIYEKDQQSEMRGKLRINQWIDLQNRPTFGLDPLAYNKELQLAVETLRNIPSVALILLEQGQFESASSYHSRVIKLMVELGGQHLSAAQTPLSIAIVQQYAHGIYDTAIRSQVTKYMRSVDMPSLQAVARRHKSLQLARELEKALDKDLYSPDDRADIQRYIELLRGPMESGERPEVQSGYVLPMTREDWALVAKMRDLPDPSRMTPNQPRDRYHDRLEYPKNGIGVQCDINFSAQLALQNTYLLRCYSLTDPRVRPIVLFVKHWAKVRGINTAYRGTLSSYGYVLLVLHYLMNVARPAVCPNLQLLAPPVPPDLTPEQIENSVQCKGRDIRFWRDADQIADAAQRGLLSQNTESIGFLLHGFFEYYAQNKIMGAGHMRGFDWGRDVISIRSLGGLLTKRQKGWTGAKTVLEVQQPDKPPVATESVAQTPNLAPAAESQDDGPSGSAAHPLLPSPGLPTVPASVQDRGKPEVKEVRHRFLVAIEDPFELDHNVARTVTHNGIVSIRDEFRRAWRIIQNAGKGQSDEYLLRDVSLEEKKTDQSSFWELLDDIHGQPPPSMTA